MPNSYEDKIKQQQQAQRYLETGEYVRASVGRIAQPSRRDCK